MKNLMIMLTSYSVALSVVILFYMAITPLLSKRYSARGLYYSWLVIVIGLLIPFRPPINTTIVHVKAPAEAILTNPMTAIPALPVKVVSQMNNIIPGPTLSDIQWWQFTAVIWLAGVFIFLFCHGLRHYRFVKMTHRWCEDITDEQILVLMRNIKEDSGISRQISLHLCPHIGSPMMIGLFHPRILLPMTAFSQDELRFILKHELIHYKRKDLWYKLLLLIATAIHWFKPVVYLMVKAINIQCELSCDTEVVQSTNMSTRYQYCETILGVLKMQSKLKTVLSTNFFGGKNGMKNRILSIMDNRKKKVGLSVICAVLIITAGVGIAGVAADSGSTLNRSASNMISDVIIRLRNDNSSPENYGTFVRNVDARPELEFYIDGEEIAQIEITCNNEYLYAVDWTETQHEKYWNTDYFQTYDEKTQTTIFNPERLYDKSIKLTFDEGFSDYDDIWYRWTAWNLYQWASEDNFSHFSVYGISLETESSKDLTGEHKLMLAAGNNGSGTTGLGHIQLDGYPDKLTEDRITVKITDREGNSVTKFIHVKVSNDKVNQTVVTASVEN